MTLETVLLQMLIGILAGGGFGFLFGLGVALLSRDGIWPFLWAGMIGAGAVGGVAIAGVDLGVRWMML